MVGLAPLSNAESLVRSPTINSPFKLDRPGSLLGSKSVRGLVLGSESTPHRVNPAASLSACL